VGIIAGGDEALRFSREGAEDDAGQAASDLAKLDPPLTDKDVVVGITASGTTPYVNGAIEAARSHGAHTVLLCCNPACGNPAGAHRVIALPTGPEVLAGSTRLKAGTATKLVLNMLTTGAMALTGHIHKGLMVGMQPLCEKLRRRALGIVRQLTDVSEEEAKILLEKADLHIPVAVLMQREKITRQEAQARLEQSGGSLGRALKTEEEKRKP
jgi:N-acetylmuramic acid 6-phosphate etherase